jgi:hypothetical protein
VLQILGDDDRVEVHPDVPVRRALKRHLARAAARQLPSPT